MSQNHYFFLSKTSRRHNNEPKKKYIYIYILTVRTSINFIYLSSNIFGFGSSWILGKSDWQMLMFRDSLPVPPLTSQAVQEELHFLLKLGPIFSLETSVT